MIRGARGADRIHAEDLLRRERLPLDGVEDNFGSFFVTEVGDRIVGAVGLEWYGDVALLRSVVVGPGERGTGLGDLLTRRAIAEASARGIRALYTCSRRRRRASFPRFGFVRVGRTDLPNALEASREFQGACPASAIAMRAR